MRNKLLFGVIMLSALSTVGCKVVRAQGPPTAGYVVYQNYVPVGTCNLPNYLTVTTVGTDAGVYQCKGSPLTWQQVGPASGGITQLQGDVLAGPGTGIQNAVLAAIGAGASNCGDATHVCQVTYDTKGRITSTTSVTITGAGGGISSILWALPSWLTASPTTLTSNGTQTFSATTGQTSHLVIGTCNALTAFAPCALVAADIPALPYLASGTQLAITKALVTHQFFTSYTSSTGLFTSAQPAFTDISGVATAAQLPNPTASTIGGVQSYTAVSNQFLTSISTLGVPVSAQPSFANLSGALGTTQGPVLTGLLKDAAGTLSAATAGTDYLLPNGSSAALSLATTSAFGVVKPDGTTITITAGVISAVGGGGGISVVGTPTAGQNTIWVTASSVQAGHCTDNGTINNCTLPQQVTSTAGPSGYYFTVNGIAGATLANSAGIGIASSLTTPSFVTLFDAPCSGLWTVANTSSIMASTCTATIGTSLITNNAVTSAKMAVVNTYQTCDIPVGDTSGSAIVSGQMGPQSRVCFVPAASTIVEMDVNADAGTPNVIIGRNHAGTITNIVSSALATAASGGIACSKTGATTGLNGATTCSATLQNTSLAAGDYLELVSGTPGGTAKFFVAHIIYTIN